MSVHQRPRKGDGGLAVVSAMLVHNSISMTAGVYYLQSRGAKEDAIRLLPSLSKSPKNEKGGSPNRTPSVKCSHPMFPSILSAWLTL
jgi:hypothetical protein